MNAQNHTRVVPSYTINMKTGEVKSGRTVWWPRKNKNAIMSK